MREIARALGDSELPPSRRPRWLRPSRGLKRLMDVTLSLGSLIALSPVVALVALTIRVQMGSPVIFRQMRPGYRGEPFEILKFRTMTDRRGPDGEHLPPEQRITKLGYLLRRTSLDELPELWNILKGEMSLVGPRPLLMEYLPHYSPEQARRHEVKPGLTGLAQVSGRQMLDFDDRFELDIWYLDHWSLGLDLWIVGKTALQLLMSHDHPAIDAEYAEFGAPDDPTADGSTGDLPAPPLLVSPKMDAGNPSFEAGFFEPGSQEWAEALTHLHHDVYHLPEFVRFAARQEEPGTPLCFIARDGDRRFFVPLIIRPIPVELQDGGHEPLFDAAGSRGYPGPLADSPTRVGNDDFLEHAILAFRDGLRERSIVTAFVRLHPFLSPPTPALERAGRVEAHGHAVWLDLDLSTEQMWQRTRQNHRRDIKRARQAGYTVRIDEAWSTFDQFLTLYGQTMDRLQADAFWHLPDAYFRDLRDSLGEHLHLCVAESDGEVVAAAILTEVDGITEYFFAGTATGHLGASPSKLVIDFAREWAKSRGNRILDLAGSLGPSDPLLHFKTGFSDIGGPVLTWRITSDEAAYGKLLRTWESINQRGADLVSDFFPAYREQVGSAGQRSNEP